MLITQNQFVCKNARDNYNRISYVGNLAPNIRYHKLLRPFGKSDITVVDILSEPLFLYRYNNGDTESRLNFKSSAAKYNFGVNQIKDSVTCREKDQLVSNNQKTIIIEYRASSNEMFLIINFEIALKITNVRRSVADLDSSELVPWLQSKKTLRDDTDNLNELTLVPFKGERQ